MNCKKANLSYLLLVVIHYIVIVGIYAYYYLIPGAGEISIVANLILSESIVVLPMLFVAMRNMHGEPLRHILGFHKIKISTALMTVLFTFLVMPLATLCNAISMLFVDNAVAGISGDIVDVPFLLMFFLMAVFGPLCEEIAFRGVLLRSYRRSGNIFRAVLMSSILFGLMHMNFNQAGYAFVLGIMMALLVEATGSTTTSFLFHLLFNGSSVVMLYVENYLLPEGITEEITGMGYTTEELLAVISVYLIFAVGGTAIALCVLVWMAGNEGRYHFFPTIWNSRKVKVEKIITPTLIIGIALSILYMIIEVVLV